MQYENSKNSTNKIKIKVKYQYFHQKYYWY